MTKTYSLPGGSGPFQSLVRVIFLIGATVLGFFIFAASAAFIFFIVIGLVILAAIAFVVFWARAKILGKPMTPYGRMKADFEGMAQQQQGDEPSPNTDKTSGPIIDAHETPDGWSVDSD